MPKSTLLHDVDGWIVQCVSEQDVSAQTARQRLSGCWSQDRLPRVAPELALCDQQQLHPRLDLVRDHSSSHLRRTFFAAEKFNLRSQDNTVAYSRQYSAELKPGGVDALQI